MNDYKEIEKYINEQLNNFFVWLLPDNNLV